MEIELIVNLILALSNVFLVKKFVHIFQLKSYSTVRYFGYIIKKQIAPILCYLFALIICLFVKFWIVWLGLYILCSAVCWWFTLHINKTNKTPLVKTKKTKRLIAISCVVCVLCGAFKFGYLISCLIINFVPIIANAINLVDIVKNNHYIRLAKQKLKNCKCKVIAITGSNGKTSVKNILQKMLETKYFCQCTPSSYNTPLGISKFINESLSNTTQFLILEYGARHVGDIKKLTKLFGADYGIVTTIAPQHMQTFKTINNIVKAKQQLPAFLGKKMCVFNLDNIFTQKMAQEKQGKKMCVSKNIKTDIYATDIKIDNFKTTFKVNTAYTQFDVSTCLLGRHNITNILLASALALHLGVAPQNLQTAIQNLTYTPHRLELVKTHINILDDSYNCSLSSAKEALDVLSKCTGKKMIVTPGIIEGGKKEKELNFTLGKWCAKADFVVFVNKHNRQSLTDGLISVDATKKVLFADTLEQAKQHFKLLNSGDTLLLLNDLPDDYT